MLGNCCLYQFNFSGTSSWGKSMGSIRLRKGGRWIGYPIYRTHSPVSQSSNEIRCPIGWSAANSS
ncbi:hypothetical protein RchiOBHm_Chr7g0225021 [Rosa chinensis]|uniref:Uncharacterized protein n=1 Tax=Rosa chinensis TaxID=74649 RepID=A0A2P6PDZ7_ROSCH|nr:hypothetical protein RchiOBHm_Chr7g0225021 [Rosa chinensis]